MKDIGRDIAGYTTYGLPDILTNSQVEIMASVIVAATIYGQINEETITKASCEHPVHEWNASATHSKNCVNVYVTFHLLQAMFGQMPSSMDIRSVGEDPFVSYKDLTMPNMVLVFSGNAALTTKASLLPPVAPGNVLKEDQIKQGKAALFAGENNWKTLWFLIIPGLLTLHIIAVTISLRGIGVGITAGLKEYFCSSTKPLKPPGRENKEASTESGTDHKEVQGDRLRDRCWKWASTGGSLRKQVRIHAAVRVYKGALRMMQLLSVVGLGLMILNASTESTNDGAGCMDHFIATTVASSIHYGSLYQWLFILFSALSILVLGLAVETLRRRSSELSGIGIYSVISYLCLAPEDKQTKRAIQQWRARVVQSRCHDQHHNHSAFEPLTKATKALAMPTVTTGRMVLYWLLHLPLLVLASAPACGYVLSQNVPAGGGWYWAIIGNPIVIAGIKLGFSEAIVPKAAALLALFRHGFKHGVSTADILRADPTLVIMINRRHVETMILFEVVTVLLAPMFAVFVLDESCFRYYINFAPDLKSLLRAWKIDMIGVEAYRPGFCSRQLVHEFSYVWLSIVLMHCLLTPALKLFKENRAIKEKIIYRAQQAAEDTLKAVSSADEKLEEAKSKTRAAQEALQEAQKALQVVEASHKAAAKTKEQKSAAVAAKRKDAATAVQRVGTAADDDSKNEARREADELDLESCRAAAELSDAKEREEAEYQKKLEAQQNVDEKQAAFEEACDLEEHVVSSTCWDEDLHQNLIKCANQMQRDLAKLTGMILTITSFGPLVPALLLLAPLTMFLNLKAEQWVCRDQERQFGELIILLLDVNAEYV